MKKYRRILIVVLAVAVVLTCVFAFLQAKGRIPGELWLRVGTEENYDLELPFSVEFETDAIYVLSGTDGRVPAEKISINGGTPFTLSSDAKGEYTASVKLFGFITVAEIPVSVVEDMSLIACGIPIGIYMETDGILVLGTGEFTLRGGGQACPAEGIVRTGDYILEVNGQAVKDKEGVVEAVQNSGNAPVTLKLRRGESTITVRLNPECASDGAYKLGVWIRDDSAGIGTMTYIDPADGSFGALGHGVSDGDTGQLFQVGAGEIYEAEILSVVKGKRGDPGELVGTMCRTEEKCLGKVSRNTRKGIFGGTISEKMDLLIEAQELRANTYPIALRQDARKGSAYILNGFSGTIERYSVEIEEVHLGAKDNKGLVLRVTDERLLEKSGGIVQGMSGSPIIQNGKIIGAVTHVLVNDPTRGYGIFIEEMLEIDE